ncbi:MAG: MoaD family protein [Methanocellales archaeon]|nr:MoaD family protein [Methanocellales archaeon]
MKVYVKFYATFRDIVGQREIQRRFDGTVCELLDRLCKEYGEEFKKATFDESKLRSYIKILVNGRDIEFLDGLHTKLSDNDVVAIFPPVGGG